MQNILQNEKTFKEAAKNLSKELTTISENFKLSHSATLNLLARTIGYSDYNTVKPLLNTPQVINNNENNTGKFREIEGLLITKGLNDENIKEAISWIKKASYRDFDKNFRESLFDADNIKIKTIEEFYFFALNTIVNYYTSCFSVYPGEAYVHDDDKADILSDEVLSYLMQHDYIKAVGNYFINDEFLPEIEEAAQKADIYFTNKMIISHSEQSLVELIREIDKCEEAGIVNIDIFNECSTFMLDDEKLLKLENSQIRIYSADDTSKTILIDAFMTVNKLSESDYQIHVGEIMSELLKSNHA